MTHDETETADHVFPPPVADDRIAPRWRRRVLRALAELDPAVQLVAVVGAQHRARAGRIGPLPGGSR